MVETNSEKEQIKAVIQFLESAEVFSFFYLYLGQKLSFRYNPIPIDN